ncbi:MAG TPA: ABC transporter permease subunit [Anaerolineae bacterium]|nr:ABC transporter permease subunit [Anaerolineae bacterium]
MEKSANKYRLHAINILQKQVSLYKFWGIGIFIVMAAAFAISSLILVNALKYTETNIVMVKKQPLLLPIMVNAVLISLYLALLSSANVSREYDKGIIELLMYGPVDEASFIIGNFLAYLKIFILSLVTALVWSNLCIWLLNLTFHWNILALFLASIFMAAQLISLGLLTATWGGKTRSALVYFVLITLFLASIKIADTIVVGLVQVNSSTINDPLLIVRDVLAFINSIIRWISPYSLLQNAMNAVLDQTPGVYLLSMGIMFTEMLIMLFSNILALKKKGARG